MKNKKTIYLILSIILLVTIGAILYINLEKETETNESGIKYEAANQQGLNLMKESKFLSSSTKGIALMIEFHDDISGLSNYVNILSERDIPGVLKVTPDYIDDHCEDLKTIRESGIKIASGISAEPFWDKPYEEQLEKMKAVQKNYKQCFGEDVEIFSSRYFAYDENTIRAAEEVGIDYILARGTTGNRATIYKPKEYDVKLFSVSNINSPEYGTGSLCDYSYWARAGEPKEFENKLFDSLKFDQISPVSHTYLGGLKENWNEVYLNFFNEAEVDWQTWEEFTAEPDLTLPFSKIPQNREVQYEEPKPKEPIEETNDVENPCLPKDLSNKGQDESEVNQKKDKEEIIMFHNDKGSMCREAKDFFQENKIEFKEILTTDENFSEQLNLYKKEYPETKGLSSSYGYYPFIFVGEEAYSGFNEEIKEEISEKQGR